MSRPRGTVDERRPGVWRLRAEGPPDPLTGQRLRATRTAYVSGKRQAQRELVKLLTEIGTRPRTGTTKAKTVADACDAWLTMFDALVAAGKKSPASAKRFHEVIDWYVLPAMGAKTLRDLTTEQINALYLCLLTKGKPVRDVTADRHGQIRAPRPLAAATVQKTHVALSLALAYAVKLGWLDIESRGEGGATAERHRGPADYRSGDRGGSGSAFGGGAHRPGVGVLHPPVGVARRPSRRDSRRFVGPRSTSIPAP